MRDNLTRLSPEDRDYYQWLLTIEKRGILPLKWAILFITLFLWLWSTRWRLIDPRVFCLFLGYTMFNIAHGYFLYFQRIELRQAKAFCYASYFVDLLFVTFLIFLDSIYYYGLKMQSDFYVFYFLLILRGFALFRTYRESLFASIIISLLFIVSIRFQERSFAFIGERGFAIKLVLIWLVILMSWFIMEMINRQKSEIINIKERLLKSEHLASLGEVAAGVAHEINNPIGIISAYSEYLLKRGAAEEESQEDLKIIHNEAQRCKQILLELLSYAAPSMKEIKEYDLRQLNDEVLNLLFRSEKDQKIIINKQYQPDIPNVLIDPTQMKQALLNIYINAKQAVDPEKGIIQSSISQDEPDSNKVKLEIQDNGIGINKDDLNRVFEPFYSGKKDGTGLGLSIAQRIIKAHQGDIVIRPARPRGTIVTISLPLIATKNNIKSKKEPTG